MTSSLPVPSPSQSSLASSRDRRWEGRLFGPFRLVSPDGTDATPASRKARALVAYLLTATDDVPTRECLAGLLWSERGDDQARASLRQTLYELRALTSGDAPLIGIDRARVTLVAGRVATDSARLDEAARADDASALVAVVGGRPTEFLADLDGIDPAFDDWLSVERTRRRDGRRRALLAAADRRLAAHDADAAQQLADCLLACDPADETAARVAMQASYRRGDRDAVRRSYANLTEALRRQIDVSPSDESDEVYRRLMASPPPRAEPLPVVPEDGHAAEAPPSQNAPALAAPEASAEVADAPIVVMHESPERRPRRQHRWTLLAGAIALLTVCAVEFAGWRHAGAASMQRFLVVEPLQVAQGDAAAAALRSGFSAELARLVVGKPAFVVREADPQPDEAPERTFVVTADAQSEGGVLHASLRLLARKNGPILWSTTLARPVDEVDALREQMAARIADVAFCALDGRHVDLRAFRPETLQLLFGACDARHDEPAEAAKLLERLVGDLPDFGHGWAMLAVASAGEDDPTATVAAGTTSRTEAYVRRALELDPHDGDAYIGRTYALPGFARWTDRMAILREGLVVDPDHAGLAFALAVQLAQLGYVQQAISWSERATYADPFNPLIAAEHAKMLGLGGISLGPEAAHAFENARRRFGNDAHVVLADFRYQALLGDYRRAAKIIDDPGRGLHFHPDRAALWRALIETRAEPSPAHAAAAERAFDASMRAIPDINMWTLETLSFLDRVDEAYENAARMRPPSSDEYDMDSLFSDASRRLRADPRFMTLAARLGLARIWKSTDQWPDFCSAPDLGYDCRVEATRALSADPRPLTAKP